MLSGITESNRERMELFDNKTYAPAFVFKFSTHAYYYHVEPIFYPVNSFNIKYSLPPYILATNLSFFLSLDTKLLINIAKNDASAKS